MQQHTNSARGGKWRDTNGRKESTIKREEERREKPRQRIKKKEEEKRIKRLLGWINKRRKLGKWKVEPRDIQYETRRGEIMMKSTRGRWRGVNEGKSFLLIQYSSSNINSFVFFGRVHTPATHYKSEWSRKHFLTTWQDNKGRWTASWRVRARKGWWNETESNRKRKKKWHIWGCWRRSDKLRVKVFRES